MDYIEIIGITAAVITTAANVPQAIKIIRTKSTESISTVTYALLLTGFILWLFYGIRKEDLPIILANAISAILAIIILYMKLTAKKSKADFPV